MNDKGLGHVVLFGCLQKSNQRFKRGILVVMTTAARIGLFIRAARFYALFRKHKPECVTVCIPGFTNAGHPGHMATDTAPKGVNAVNGPILDRGMTGFAQTVLEQSGFG